MSSRWIFFKNTSCITYFWGISALGTLSNIHSANWGKTTKYLTFCNLLLRRAPALPFWDILYFSLHEALPNCLLTVSKVSIVRHRERCPSYREYDYSKMTEKRQGPTPVVRLREVSDKKELSLYSKIKMNSCWCLTGCYFSSCQDC